MSDQNQFLSAALKAWKTNIDRAGKFFSSLSDEQLLQEVAPGKNRLIYLFGHLTAVHDGMLPLLGLGEKTRPDFDAAFVSNPDKSRSNLPSPQEVKESWKDVNAKLSAGFEKFSAAEWLQRHSAVSEEDFAKDPSRNRYAILLSRTNHVAYHMGQLNLAPK
jgi:uncharacterized damage-inducible protein DinB